MTVTKEELAKLVKDSHRPFWTDRSFVICILGGILFFGQALLADIEKRGDLAEENEKRLSALEQQTNFNLENIQKSMSQIQEKFSEFAAKPRYSHEDAIPLINRMTIVEGKLEAHSMELDRRDGLLDGLKEADTKMDFRVLSIERAVKEIKDDLKRVR